LDGQRDAKDLSTFAWDPIPPIFDGAAATLNFSYDPEAKPIPFQFSLFEWVEESRSQCIRYPFSVIGDRNGRILADAYQPEQGDSQNEICYSRIEIAARLTEIMLLGCVSLRAGQKIEWDGPKMVVRRIVLRLRSLYSGKTVRAGLFCDGSRIRPR
jgi:hypothetical protein